MNSKATTNATSKSIEVNSKNTADSASSTTQNAATPESNKAETTTSEAMDGYELSATRSNSATAINTTGTISVPINILSCTKCFSTFPIITVFLLVVGIKVSILLNNFF